jgi:hypothetical protein
MVKFSYQLPLSFDTYARWTALHWQINLTCDDMNITGIQVGTRSHGVALSPAPQVLCNQHLQRACKMMPLEKLKWLPPCSKICSKTYHNL